MNIYADTSWWIAYKRRKDAHHSAAISVFDRTPEGRVFWTTWHRVEVFNAFRQAERAKLIPPGEATAVIRSLEQEIRIGYWQHVEFDWNDAVRTACELSAAYSLRQPVRGMDLFHVAIAAEIGADAFLSFDNSQNSLARAAGFGLVELGTKRKN